MSDRLINAIKLAKDQRQRMFEAIKNDHRDTPEFYGNPFEAHVAAAIIELLCQIDIYETPDSNKS